MGSVEIIVLKKYADRMTADQTGDIAVHGDTRKTIFLGAVKEMGMAMKLLDAYDSSVNRRAVIGKKVDEDGLKQEK